MVSFLIVGIISLCLHTFQLRVDGLTTYTNETALTKVTVKNGSNTTATTETTSQPIVSNTATPINNVPTSDLTNRPTEEVHPDTENNSTSATFTEH